MYVEFTGNYTPQHYGFQKILKSFGSEKWRTNWTLEIMYRLFYSFIGIVFRIGLLPFFRVEVDGIESYSESASSMIVTNHKRDLDSILVASVFYYRNGYLRPGEQISFMGDENLFQPGFLGDWLNKSKLLQSTLKSVSVGPILKKLNAYPIGKLEFNSLPIHEVLRIIEKKNGSCPLTEVLERETLKALAKKLPDHPSELTIANYFSQQGYPRRKIKLTEIKRPYRRLIKQKKVSSVKEQLKRFVKLLDEGGILYITPEGQLSEDGSLGSLRDSLHILIEETKSTATIIPTNITYDFMTDEKPTIFVKIGSEIRGLAKIDRKARTKKLRKALLQLTTVTMGQLGSRRLIKRADKNRFQIPKKQLCEQVLTDLEKLNDQDILLDARLRNPQEAGERWEKFLNYCFNKGILRNVSNKPNILIIDKDLGFNKKEIDRGYRRDPVRYSANELKALEKINLVKL